MLLNPYNYQNKSKRVLRQVCWNNGKHSSKHSYTSCAFLYKKQQSFQVLIQHPWFSFYYCVLPIVAVIDVECAVSSDNEQLGNIVVGRMKALSWLSFCNTLLLLIWQY